MKSTVAGDAGFETRVVILDSGEEAFGWFDFENKTYKKIEVEEQCEVVSAIGDVAIGDDGNASLHVHVVLGLSNGMTRGGHLLAGTVRPTLEVVLIDTPSHLRRKKHPDIGIALIDLEAGKR